jgi:hypothetical protein
VSSQLAPSSPLPVVHPGDGEADCGALCVVELELVSSIPFLGNHLRTSLQKSRDFCVISILLWSLSITCMPPLLYEMKALGPSKPAPVKKKPSLKYVEWIFFYHKINFNVVRIIPIAININYNHFLERVFFLEMHDPNERKLDPYGGCCAQFPRRLPK